MNWKRSAGATMALMGVLMTGYAEPWRADVRLVSTLGLATPQVDGMFEPEVWRPAYGVLVELRRMDGPRRSDKKIDVVIRSLVASDRVHFLVQWPDEYPVDAFNPLVWTAKGGRQRYEAHEQADDSVSLIFTTEGSYDRLMALGSECRADRWGWGAGSTNDTQYATDAMLALGRVGRSTGERVYQDPFSSRKMGMQIFSDDGTPAKRDRIPTAFEGEIILPFVPQEPSGSLADVRAAGQWDPAKKKWSVEFARNLSTGYDDDVAFVPGQKYGMIVGLQLVSEDGYRCSYVSQLVEFSIAGGAPQLSVARTAPRPAMSIATPRPATQRVVATVGPGDARIRTTTKIVGQTPKLEVTRMTPPATPPPPPVRVPSHTTSIAPVGARFQATTKAIETASWGQPAGTPPVALPSQLPANVPEPQRPPNPVVPSYEEVVEVKPVAPVLPANARVWSFDDMATGDRPSGFQRQGGRWFVRYDPSAPSSPLVYAQLSRAQTGKTDPGAIYKGRTHTDFSCSVAIRLLPESVAGGGIILRHRDVRNYYALELDAQEDTLKLLLFAAGREAIVGAPVGMEVEPDRWYNLKVECQNDQFTCYVDGQPVLNVMEGTLATGYVGLWARRGTVAYFDDFAIGNSR